MSHTSEIRELAVTELDQVSGGTSIFAAMSFFEKQHQIASGRLLGLTEKTEKYDKQNDALSKSIRS